MLNNVYDDTKSLLLKKADLYLAARSAQEHVQRALMEAVSITDKAMEDVLCLAKLLEWDQIKADE